MRSIREQLKGYGIEIEPRYIIYRTQERVLAVPYSHIRTLELKENRVVLYTGGVDRVLLELPNTELANMVFEDILLHIERLYI